MMITSDDFWGLEKDTQNEIKDSKITVLFAKVIELTPVGQPIIVFDGETLPTQKIYTQLSSYKPVKGDRVMLLNGIIMGNIGMYRQ